jgi:hypothetical protein
VKCDYIYDDWRLSPQDQFEFAQDADDGELEGGVELLSKEVLQKVGLDHRAVYVRLFLLFPSYVMIYGSSSTCHIVQTAVREHIAVSCRSTLFLAELFSFAGDGYKDTGYFRSIRFCWAFG